MGDEAPWTPLADGLRLLVRVTPRGGRDGIDGVSRLADGRCALKIRVAAAAEDGKANVAVARVLTRILDLPAVRVKLVQGATSRLKIFRLEGDAAELSERLDRAANPT